MTREHGVCGSGPCLQVPKEKYQHSSFRPTPACVCSSSVQSTKAQGIILPSHARGEVIYSPQGLDSEVISNAERLTRTHGLLKWSRVMQIQLFPQHLCLSCLDWCLIRWSEYVLFVPLNTNWHGMIGSVSLLFSQTEIDIHRWHFGQSCLNNVTQKEGIVEKNVHRMVLLSHLMLLHMCSGRKHFEYSPTTKMRLKSQGGWNLKTH